MAEVQPPEGQVNGGGGVVATTTPAMGSSETVGTKRQRRPSVRLGDIGGDQPYDSHNRRNNKHWKLSIDNHHHRNAKDFSIRTSKTRPLTNFGSSGASGSDPLDTLEADDREREANLETLAIGSWKAKDSKKRSSMGTKRPRSNWVSSKVDDEAYVDDKFRHREDIDDGYRDFEVENSESLLKEQSPIQSLENLAVDGHGNEREVLYHGNRRPIRARASEARGDNHDGVELSGPSDTDGREWKCGGEDGVRVWLNGLGLGRYAPVFEIHEVDDEVLPLLTLEDLKDMGINAVGSRRKMFCAIQKLGKGFS